MKNCTINENISAMMKQNYVINNKLFGGLFNFISNLLIVTFWLKFSWLLMLHKCLAVDLTLNTQQLERRNEFLCFRSFFHGKTIELDNSWNHLKIIIINMPVSGIIIVSNTENKSLEADYTGNS